MRTHIRRFTMLALALTALLLATGERETKAACLGLSQPVSCFAFETITVSSTALPFTVATAFPAGGLPATVLAQVTIETNPIRYRVDGVVPTAAVGHLLNPQGPFDVCGEANIRAWRMIRTGSDSTVSATYCRPVQ